MWELGRPYLAAAAVNGGGPQMPTSNFPSLSDGIVSRSNSLRMRPVLPVQESSASDKIMS